MDSTAAAAAAAALAAVQALSEALQPAVFQRHKLTLPPFWTQDPVGWFLHAEAEFALARVPANSYLCYMHVVRALPSEVLTAVRDLTRGVTAATPEPYLLIKDALLSRFTSSPLQMCFKLLDLPPLGDRRPSALFAEMQSLLPRDANVLFNAMFLCRLPEAMRTALADRGEVLPGELAAAADLLLHTAPLPVAALAPAVPAPATPPVLSGQTVSAVQPSRRATSPSPSRFRRTLPHLTVVLVRLDAAVLSRHHGDAHRYLSHLLIPSSVSITTTLAAKPAIASLPAGGRETSSGPGGSSH
jgi:hypothetical protein